MRIIFQQSPLGAHILLFALSLNPKTRTEQAQYITHMGLGFRLVPSGRFRIVAASRFKTEWQSE